jgi:hypothetical protein
VLSLKNRIINLFYNNFLWKKNAMITVPLG